MVSLCQMPTKKPDPRDPDRLLVFFDGVCHLCNGFVDAVIIRDSSRRILFAPFQGETAEQTLNPDQRRALSTILVKDGSRSLEKSDAVLRILQELPGWKWVAVFHLIPQGLRDSIYDFVARHRYGWFGEREFCRIPTPEERDQLLP